MAQFYELSVSDVRRETPQSVSISLHVPDSLKEIFAYRQGQYLTFKLMVNGEEIRRSYSLCSCPYSENEIRVAIKEVAGGRGSTFLNKHIKPGDKIMTMAPAGNFYSELQEDNQKHYHLFAGGSGITPMYSILKSVLAKEPKSRITLYYGNQNETSTIFLSGLKQLAEMHPSRVHINWVFEEPSNSTSTSSSTPGRLDLENTDKLISGSELNQEVSEFFICGPSPMMDAVKKTLLQKGVAEKLIHIEYFSSPVDSASDAESKSGTRCASKATIILDGDTYEIEVEAGENILDAALRKRLDAPYACQGGSCCTCRAKLTEGKVDMAVNYALLDNEVEEGYILTCQSYPLTDTIVVDYDRGK